LLPRKLTKIKRNLEQNVKQQTLLVTDSKIKTFDKKYFDIRE